MCKRLYTGCSYTCLQNQGSFFFLSIWDAATPGSLKDAVLSLVHFVCSFPSFLALTYLSNIYTCHYLNPLFALFFSLLPEESRQYQVLTKVRFPPAIKPWGVWPRLGENPEISGHSGQIKPELCQPSTSRADRGASVCPLNWCGWIGGQETQHDLMKLSSGLRFEKQCVGF